MAFLAKIGMHLFQNKRRSVNIILATLTTKISDKKLFLSPRSIFEIFSACSLYCCLPACDNFNLRHIEDKLQSRLSLSRSIPSFDSSLNIWSWKSIFFSHVYRANTSVLVYTRYYLMTIFTGFRRKSQLTRDSCSNLIFSNQLGRLAIKAGKSKKKQEKASYATITIGKQLFVQTFLPCFTNFYLSFVVFIT